jgi:hypothetical protein
MVTMIAVTELPASPPPAVLAEVYAALGRTAELAAAGIEVDFAPDDDGRLAITLRDGDGVRALRPSAVFDLLD